MHFPAFLVASRRRIVAHMAVSIAMAMVFMATVVPSAAWAKTGSFVYDQKEMLSESEFQELEKKGKDYAEQYNMGVYLLFCSGMGSYDPSPSERNEYARNFFVQNNLGVGSGKNGIIFVVAVDSRDYVTVKHIGTNDKDPFSNDCVDDLEDTVTDYLGDDDWSGGARAYYETVGEQLSYFAKNNKAWRRPDTFGLLLKIAFTVGVPLAVALIVISVEKKAMKTARLQADANAYEGEGLKLDVSNDIFTHRTHSVRPKPKDKGSNSHGGWSSMGGGFSGSGGGKF